jgi:hypothetical protein
MGYFPKLGLDFENRILLLLIAQNLKESEFRCNIQWHNVDAEFYEHGCIDSNV